MREGNSFDDEDEGGVGLHSFTKSRVRGSVSYWEGGSSFHGVSRHYPESNRLIRPEDRKRVGGRDRGISNKMKSSQNAFMAHKK
ncbi:Hypothetical protein FKW44_002837 [Caligus rogercresseyi]|uniref:Uncharacterized protein n=1 Tax=Caligus rogercresseyi TaxID=217165 RepID=A0A7T8KKQ9_CALRO|nr:Hypothetical protein FKW44_002837 [Caligus rogercresseyi]